MKDTFEVERLRDKLAVLRNLSKFKQTYIYVYKDLKNLNTRKFWDKKISEDNDNKLVGSPIYREKIRIVANYLKKYEGNLMDIGFGSGHVEQHIDNNKWSLNGVDLSHTAVRYLRSKIKGNFRVGNIFKLQSKDSFFDAVLTLDVLEHLPADKIFGVYKDIKRILKKNGLFIISVPLNEGLEEMVKVGRNPNGHLRAYTPAIIRAELKISGFSVMKEFYLYAFKKSYYIKSLIVKLLPIRFKDPNLLIIIAKKK